MKASDEILTEARNYVARGWCQRSSMFVICNGETKYCRDPDAYRYCATGAIYKAASIYCKGKNMTDDERSEAQRECFNRFTSAARIAPHEISYWNDGPLRTQEEVVETFDMALKR